MKLIIDMDGTVHPSPCVGAFLPKFYETAEPYKGIVDELKSFDMASTGVLVITGRTKADDAVTRRWIERNIGWGQKQFTIMYVGFVTYEKYVKAKVDEMFHSAMVCGCDVSVYEDDEIILSNVEKMIDEYNRQYVKEMHSISSSSVNTVALNLVKGGKAWKRETLLRRG